MSWFMRNSPLRSSIQKIIQTPQVDSATCFEAFRNHWSQVWTIIEKNGEGRNGPPFSLDGITAVVNNLDQLVTLLLQETTRTCPAQQGTFLPADDQSSSNGGGREEWTMGPILDFLLTEGILDKLHNFSLRSGEFVNAMKLEQLKIYEVLVSHSHPNLLFQKPVVRPLLHLLSECREGSPLEVEKRLIILLNTLCVCLSQHPQLLEVFFSASSEQEPEPQFLIFSRLIPFVHREGAIGQQARDALLLCMALSHRNDSIGAFIAEHSNFCPVLATGLSGLYSLLPRKLSVVSEDWHRFTPEDIQDMPDLEMFLNSLEFCNAVIQVAHPLVAEQLLDYIYQGFLLPVLGPALNQSVEEVIAATAYLELCLRSLSEASLIQVFLKFIICDSCEEQRILETLVKRIEAQSKLSLVTMALFKTLLDLNCEDVMLELVLKYLIPCTHVMVSQRCRVRDVDVYCQTAERLLSLVPACCFLLPEMQTISTSYSTPGIFPRTPEDAEFNPPTFSRAGSLRIKKRTLSTSSFTFGDLHSGHDADHRLGDHFQSPFPSHQASYQAYLREARQGLLSCAYACRNWSVPYDGLDPPAQPKPSSHQSPLYSMTSSYFSEMDLQPNGKPESKPPEVVNGCPRTTTTQQQQHRTAQIEDGAPTSVCSTSSSGISSVDGQMEELPSLSPENENIFCNGSSVDGAKCGGETERSQSALDGGFSSPDIGPFLNALLSRLETMMQNDVYTNLQLTGLISRLAMYPQPLVRSFLLNHTLVFQPSIRSLIQVLNTLKQKMDSYSSSVDKFENLLLKARAFLAAREERLLKNPLPRVYAEAAATNRRQTNSPFDRGDSRRRSFTQFLFGSKNIVEEPLVESIPDQQGYRYVSKPSSATHEGQLECLQSRNAALCAVVLEEFLMELAAIMQEQALIQPHLDAKPFSL